MSYPEESSPLIQFPAPGIWMTGREVRKQVSFQKTLPTDASTYGVTVSFDFDQPEDQFTIEISHLTDYQLTEFINTIAVIGADLDVDDDRGKTWSGKVLAVSYSQQKGTYFNNAVRLSMKSNLVTDN